MLSAIVAFLISAPSNVTVAVDGSVAAMSYQQLRTVAIQCQQSTQCNLPVGWKFYVGEATVWVWHWALGADKPDIYLQKVGYAQ